jgi:hypothetical protein
MAVNVASQQVCLIEKFIGEIEQPDLKAVLYLSNAVKYTDKGRISLTVTQEKRDGKRVWLKIVYEKIKPLIERPAADFANVSGGI